jgi:hypothetical protein
MGLIYFADDRGRIVTEMTCIPASDDDVGVITAAVAQSHDADLLRKGLPEGVVLEDWTDRIHCFIVTGPKARELLAGISRGRPDAALALGPVHRQGSGQGRGAGAGLLRGRAWLGNPLRPRRRPGDLRRASGGAGPSPSA